MFCSFFNKTKLEHLWCVIACNEKPFIMYLVSFVCVIVYNEDFCVIVYNACKEKPFIMPLISFVCVIVYNED